MRLPCIIIVITLVSVAILDAAITKANVSKHSLATAQVVRIEVKPLPKPRNLTLMQKIARFLGARSSLRKPAVGTVLAVQASGYAPSPYQTDSTPCITASGTRVRRGTVATNFLPMGTLLEINGRRYIVEDRMNPRYHQAIDIFFPSTSEALEFGRQELKIKILGYGEAGQSLEEKKESDTDKNNEPAEDIGFVDKVFGQFNHLKRVTAQMLGAKTYSDVNRYDVDCFKE